jgi:hypothetical protein
MVLMQFDSNFMRLVTKSEPGAVATGQGLNGKMDAGNTKASKNLSIRLVATTTPRGLPARGPRSAPGSDFVLACSARS